MRVALDTNVVAYAEGVNGLRMRVAALDLLRALPDDAIVIPVQVLGELFNVLVRKAGWPSEAARSAVVEWSDAYPVIETSVAALFAAGDLATDHQLSIWDSVILSVAAEAGCRLLLSEDLHSGFTWRGVTISNPFAEVHHPILAALLQAPKE